MYAEAFEVAEDIEDYDLFMDLFNETKSNVNLLEFAAAAFSQAATILHEEEGHVGAVNGVANNNLSTSADYRSESACSQSTYSDMQVVQRSKLQHNKYTKEHLKNYVPPLPSFKSKVFSAEMIKINIPKPELRTESTQDAIRTRPPPPPPPLPSLRSLKLLQNTNNSTAISSTLAELSMKSGSDFNNTGIGKYLHILTVTSSTKNIYIKIFINFFCSFCSADCCSIRHTFTMAAATASRCNGTKQYKPTRRHNAAKT